MEIQLWREVLEPYQLAVDELMVKFAGDGSFKYLGNKILDDGIKSIPDYQYRIPKFENPTE